MSAPQTPRDEDPRGRILRHGPKSLSNAELVAVLLRTGGAGKSALEVAQALLKDYGDLRSLLSANGQLKSQPGVGPAKSATLAAAFEIGCRMARFRAEKRRLLDQPQVVAEYLALRYLRPDQEVMGALLLDVRHRLIADLEIFAVTLRRAAAEPRPILRAALQKSASGIVLWHSHPSGDPTPSSDDLLFTGQMAKACKFVGVNLVDHLFLGGAGRWVSLQRRGAW